MSLLKCENLKLELGGRFVLNGIDFELGAGEFWVFIGPNGAGKSSFLKCILHLWSHYTGNITLAGQNNAGMGSRERARILAYVPQFLDLQFNLDVRSFMELSRFAYDDEPLKARQAIIDEALARTECSDMLDAHLDELSGGERQRVLLAGAIAQKPRLLILDEPSHSLDPVHKVEMVRLLGDLFQSESLSVLLVTHDFNELLHLDPKVAALKQGRIAFQCDARELPSRLSELYQCEFHHVTVGGQHVSIPKYG